MGNGPYLGTLPVRTLATGVSGEKDISSRAWRGNKPKPKPTVELWLEKRGIWYEVSKTGCWIWKAVRASEDGAPIVTYNSKTRRAHRVAYELFRGRIPRRSEVERTCGHKTCVNPEHLKAVSRGTGLRRKRT